MTRGFCRLKESRLFPIGNLNNDKKIGRGCLWEILKRIPKGYQEPVLWAWHEIFFTLKRNQIMGFNETKLKQFIVKCFQCHIFSAQYP